METNNVGGLYSGGLNYPSKVSLKSTVERNEEIEIYVVNPVGEVYPSRKYDSQENKGKHINFYI